MSHTVHVMLNEVPRHKLPGAPVILVTYKKGARYMRVSRMACSTPLLLVPGFSPKPICAPGSA